MCTCMLGGGGGGLKGQGRLPHPQGFTKIVPLAPAGLMEPRGWANSWCSELPPLGSPGTLAFETASASHTQPVCCSPSICLPTGGEEEPHFSRRGPSLLPHRRGQDTADAGRSPISFPHEQQSSTANTDNTCQDMGAPPPKGRLSRNFLSTYENSAPGHTRHLPGAHSSPTSVVVTCQKEDSHGGRSRLAP